MLQVIPVIVDEVPNNGVDRSLGPCQPILDGGLDIEHGPAVQFGGVHLANLIGCRTLMLAAIDGSKDNGIRVKVMTVELARIGKLEDALTNFRGRPVNLIEKESDRVVAGCLVPIRRAERSHFAVRLGKANQVAFGHLRRSALDDR